MTRFPTNLTLSKPIKYHQHLSLPQYATAEKRVLSFHQVIGQHVHHVGLAFFETHTQLPSIISPSYCVICNGVIFLLDGRLGKRGVADGDVAIIEHIGISIHLDAQHTELVLQRAVGFRRILR